jgi:hypothetical protein
MRQLYEFRKAIYIYSDSDLRKKRWRKMAKDNFPLIATEDVVEIDSFDRRRQEILSWRDLSVSTANLLPPSDSLDIHERLNGTAGLLSNSNSSFARFIRPKIPIS